MSIKYKYECPNCKLDVYFEVKIPTKTYVCPECRERALRITGYKRDGSLAVFELLEKMNDLERRIEKLDYLLNESDMDKHLVS